MAERRTAALKTDSIRSLYRPATLLPDGEYIPGSGYKPEDRIGHAVFGTIHGLCDEVDYLRAEVKRWQDAAFFDGGAYG